MAQADRGAAKHSDNEQTAGGAGYVSVSLFSSVMGLSTLCIGWQLAHKLYAVPLLVAQGVGLLALLVFLLLLLVCAVQAIRHFARVRAEFVNPLSRSFFGTFTISLLLLPFVLFQYSPLLATIIWGAGVLLMLIFSWHIIRFWIFSTQQARDITPGWIIPIVGILDIPLASPLLGVSESLHYLDVFALSTGLFFVLPVYTLIFGRLVLCGRLPEELSASLLILIAPFAVGVSAYLVVRPVADLLAVALFFIGLFMFFLLLPHGYNMVRHSAFRPGWWAASFPLAALTVAALKMAAHLPGELWNALAWVLLAGCSAVVFGLLLASVWYYTMWYYTQRRQVKPTLF